MTMRVLITGGTGFIGSHLAEGFVRHGYDVSVFDRCPQVHEFAATYLPGDVLDASAVDAAVRGHDFVVHAGGILGTHETIAAPQETSSINIIGSLNVLDAVRKYGSGLVNISKPNVWLNPYSITKDCIEKFCFMYVNEFDMPIAVVKLFNVYGPRQKYSAVQKAIPAWIVSALRGRPLEIYGQGTSTMDLVYIDDVNAAVLDIVSNFDRCRLKKTDSIAQNVWGNFHFFNEQILEIGSGVEITVNAAVNELERALGMPVERRHLPMRRGEIEGTRLRADTRRLTALTGFEPRVTLQDGLNRTVAYYKARAQLVEEGVL
jgi:UDP-glucose 4-epimerase